MNISDEIKRLHELHQAGALTDAEFEQAKAKLLSASVNLNKTADSSSSYSSSSSSSVPPGSQTTYSSDVSQLRRSRADRWLGGVCGGLAKVTGLESWIWRLVFVLTTVFIGFGLLFYVLMWIFVPEE